MANRMANTESAHSGLSSYLQGFTRYRLTKGIAAGVSSNRSSCEISVPFIPASQERLLRV
jgi:hypothetical protein